MFTKEEINFMATAIDQKVKAEGLQSAGMALTIVAKLQAEAQRQADEVAVPSVGARKAAGRKSNSKDPKTTDEGNG